MTMIEQAAIERRLRALERLDLAGIRHEHAETIGAFNRSLRQLNLEIETLRDRINAIGTTTREHEGIFAALLRDLHADDDPPR